MKIKIELNATETTAVVEMAKAINRIRLGKNPTGLNYSTWVESNKDGSSVIRFNVLESVVTGYAAAGRKLAELVTTMMPMVQSLIAVAKPAIKDIIKTEATETGLKCPWIKEFGQDFKHPGVYAYIEGGESFDWDSEDAAQFLHDWLVTNNVEVLFYNFHTDTAVGTVMEDYGFHQLEHIKTEMVYDMYEAADFAEVYARGGEMPQSKKVLDQIRKEMF